jgi:predicted nuclease of predicted toxin-antitoxin system
MKILLDECLPVDFRHSFPGHEAHSVEWAGLKGKKNGELLQAAEAGGYQVLVMSTRDSPVSR